MCVSTQVLGAPCNADKECVPSFNGFIHPPLLPFSRCDSFNCLSSGVCGKPDSEPRHFNAWVYVLVSFGIFGGEFGVQLSQLPGAHILSIGMGCVIYGLHYTHKEQREIERIKREQYWQEQVGSQCILISTTFHVVFRTLSTKTC